jgi:hypothetical protein
MDNEHLLDNFYVIAVITNPERYKRRPQLFKEFMKRMDRYGVNYYVVEGAFSDRKFEVTSPLEPRHIQIRLESELWHKENLINIGISRLPSNWQYVAWIDGDVDFVRPDWALETVHELQHHEVVQMFEDAIDMGPNNEVMTTFKGFAYCYKNGLPRKKCIKGKGLQENGTGLGYPYHVSPNSYSPGTYWHPGYAWAATRKAINTMGGILDFAVLGSGDHHMACGLIGEIDMSLPKGIHEQYRHMAKAWETRALRLHKNIGYVKGTIYHFWHGKKRDRKYKDRWQILIDNDFNPAADIHKDWQNVWDLYPGHEALRDQIRDYFQARNEDSIDRD